MVIEGSVIGGVGRFSGAILSTKAMQSVQIIRNLSGGAGNDSGEVGTAADLGTVKIGGSLNGGAGKLSGAILAAGNITSVTVANGIIGGSGADSGQIGSGKTIQSITVNGNVSGSPSGAIVAGGSIQSVNITGTDFNGPVFSGGSIGTVTIGGEIFQSSISALKDIQLVSVNVLLTPGDSITGGSGSGIVNSTVVAETGSIGAVQAGASGLSVEAISNSSIAANGNIGSIGAYDTSPAGAGASYAMLNTEVVTLGSLGNITAVSNNFTAISASQFLASQGMGTIKAAGLVGGILSSTFRAGAGIAGITAASPGGAGAIVNSGFDAGGSIGVVGASGFIDGSVFVAGINLGPQFSVTGAGTFNNGSAASFGFGSSAKPIPAHIGAVTVTNGLIEQSTFLAGVHGTGEDGKFGTVDDVVPAGSSIGAISSTGGLNTVFFESGDIGATTSGAIVKATYVSTDTAVSAAGIGAIAVNVTIPAGSKIAGQDCEFELQFERRDRRHPGYPRGCARRWEERRDRL